MPGIGRLNSTALGARASRLAVVLAGLLLPAAGWSGEPASRRVEGDRVVTDEGWSTRPQARRPALPAEVTRAFVLPIREPITVKTYQALRRKVRRCLDGKAQLVILDMDTWGGEVFAALDIARMLKTDLAEVRTVCYVRTRGISAGAMIAIACHEIVMGPVGTFGDCAPIFSSLIGRTLEGVEREKLETVLRTEFAESAELHGYNVLLAESMVTFDHEVWLVRNKATRELRYVNAYDWRSRVDAPPGLATAPANPAAEWELLAVPDRAGELLTMHPRQAVEYGFVRDLVPPGRDDPLENLLRHYNVLGAPTALEDTWSERMVEFLTTPAVTGFLFFVAILCAYIEINAPGHVLPGVMAVLCFAVIFGSHYLTGLAAWWEIGLFVLGLILLGVEIFVIPGFGFVGVLGGLLCLAGLLAMLVPNAPSAPPIPLTPTDWRIFARGAFALGVAFVLAVAASFVLARYLPRVPLAGKLVLADVGQAGGPPAVEGTPLTRIRPGDLGIVETVCRPIGKVRFGQDLVDAYSEGIMIEAGAKVRVLRRDGNQVVVEKV